MSVIARVTTWSDGQTLTASALNGEFNNILNDYNGSITNANISASAAIASSKIAVTFPSGTIVGTTDTQTLTNKTISKRVVSVSDATSITPNGDTSDIVTQTNTQGSGTLTVNAPSGTPVSGQGLIIRIKSTNSQTYSFNSTYKGGTIALPATHAGSSKYDYLGFIYNSDASKWDMVALAQAIG